MWNLLHWDGLQSVLWIETNSGDIGEVSTRGMGLGYMESLESSFCSWNGIKNDNRVEGRNSIKESGKTILDKKCFPWGYHAPLIKIQRLHNMRKPPISSEAGQG